MFPGASAQVFYNEAGEPLGWDYPSHDEDPSDFYDDDYFYGVEGDEDDD